MSKKQNRKNFNYERRIKKLEEAIQGIYEYSVLSSENDEYANEKRDLQIKSVTSALIEHVEHHNNNNN